MKLSGPWTSIGTPMGEATEVSAATQPVAQFTSLYGRYEVEDQSSPTQSPDLRERVNSRIGQMILPGAGRMASIHKRLQGLKERIAMAYDSAGERYQMRLRFWAEHVDSSTRGQPVPANDLLLDYDTKTLGELVGKGWTKLNLHPKQLALWDSKTRFAVVPCGRRSGKTELARRRFVIKGVLSPTPRRICFAAPTFDQARTIFWNRLKDLIPRWMLDKDPADGPMKITLKHNGTEFFVTGLDKPSRIEGAPLHDIVMDESANLRPEAWKLHVRPMLSETMGSAWFTGVPEGRNHYFETYEIGLENADGFWSVHHWTSEEVLPLYLGPENAAAELLAAKRELDWDSYRQEYLADWVSFSGAVYHCFDSVLNVVKKDNQLSYWNPTEPLHLCFDFNVAPGVAVIVQERGGVSVAIDEVHIEKNSNTIKVVDKILERYKNHKGNVYLYGDATGGAQGSAKVQGSDWDIIRKQMLPVFGERLISRVPTHNPYERSRVNAVNSRLKASDGTRRAYVSEICKHLIRDLEGTPVKQDGGIDKKADEKLSHISDAWGYYINARFPVVGGGMVRRAI